MVLCASDEESYKIAFDFFSTGKSDIFIAQDIEKARYLTQASYFGSHNDCPLSCIERQYSTCIKRLCTFQWITPQLGLEVMDALMQEEDEGEITRKEWLVCVIKWLSLYFNSVVISEDKADISLNLLILPSLQPVH